MNVEALMELIRDEAAFKKAFRKTTTTEKRATTDGPTNDVFELISGKFEAFKPNIHRVVLPDGSEIRLKFYDTIKRLYSNKNIELVGKESFLSYLDVTVMPKGGKGYSMTFDVNQIVWGSSKSKAQEKHDSKIAALVKVGEELGINLMYGSAWMTVYTENY